MSNNNVNPKVKKVAIEYAGMGSQPYFVIEENGEVKFIPIERGVTQLEILTKE